MNRREKEIRTVLMGFVRYEGNYVIAAENIFRSQFLGLNNGSGSARIRGLKEHRIQYRLHSGKLMGNMPIVKALLAMGAPVFLFTAPDASAILYRHWLLNPVLITFEDDHRDALICFYTAKNLFAGSVIRHCMKKLVALFPENFTPTAVTMTPFVAEDPEKAEKRAKKDHRGGTPQKDEPEGSTDEAAVQSSEEAERTEPAEPDPDLGDPTDGKAEQGNEKSEPDETGA